MSNINPYRPPRAEINEASVTAGAVSIGREFRRGAKFGAKAGIIISLVVFWLPVAAMLIYGAFSGFTLDNVLHGLHGVIPSGSAITVLLAVIGTVAGALGMSGMAVLRRLFR
jgi:hypothetical protein